MRATRALVFDFNGTLSRDEPVLYAIYSALFAEHGRPLSEADYYGRLAGNTEEAIIHGWLGVEGEELEALVEERINRYVRAADGSTVPLAVREAGHRHPLFHAFLDAAVEAGHRRSPGFNSAAPEGVGPYEFAIRGGRRWSTAQAYLQPARGRGNLTILTGAAVAALTVYDMTKAASKGVGIERIELLEKTGGKGGTWRPTSG